MRSSLYAFVWFLVLTAALPAQKIEWWPKTFEEALVAANDRPAGMVMLYCWREGDGYCTSMFSGTLSEKSVEPVLADFVCMGAKDEGATKAVLARFGVVKVPTILFVYPDGQVVDVLVGYLPVQDFIAEVKRVRAGTDTIAALREAIGKKPDDLQLQLDLLLKLRRCGDVMAASNVLNTLLEKDPAGKNEAAAEAMLLRITDELFVHGVDPKDYDTKPLRSFLSKQKHKRVLFLGYDRLAAAEWRRDDLKAAVSAAEKAWKSIPPEFVLDWGQGIAAKAYEANEELDKINKTILKRAVGISEKALEVVEKRHKQNPDNVWLANAIYLHASVLIVANQRKEAFAAMDRAIDLDPSNENLKLAKKRWVDGSK